MNTEEFREELVFLGLTRRQLIETKNKIRSQRYGGDIRKRRRDFEVWKLKEFPKVHFSIK